MPRSQVVEPLGHRGPGFEQDFILGELPPEDLRLGAEVASVPARNPVLPEPLLRSLAQLLQDPDALSPPAPVIPRLAYRGRVTLVVGREKLGGKSTLLTAGAAALTGGADFLGEACSAGTVLWVSADHEHPSEITQRAVRFGADPERFHVLWPHQQQADLATALERVDATAIIIDTLANFARVEDPHSSAEWPAALLPLVHAARERELAVAIAHHAVKGPDGGYRDSTAIGALVDFILELQSDGANPSRRNVKAIGRWPVPSFAVDLVGDRYELVTGAELSLDARILAFIRANPAGLSLRAVRGIGGRAEDVDRALDRLRTSGAVRDEGTEHRHAYIAAATDTAAHRGEDPNAPPV